jgi:hypothetical protein
MLPSESILSVISACISPGLNAFAMLEVVSPHSLILRSIDMLVDTKTIGFVVCPLAIINVAINVNELTFTMSSVFTPLSNVLGTVRPMLLALAVTETSLPFTVVDGTTLEAIRWAFLTTLVGIEGFLRRNSLLALFISEVLAASNVLAS